MTYFRNALPGCAASSSSRRKRVWHGTSHDAGTLTYASLKWKEVSEMENEEGALVASPPAVVKPVLTVKEALANFREFQSFKDEVLTDEDKKPIGNKPYIWKPGWRKIKTACNLSLEILDLDPSDGTKGKRTMFDNGDYMWTYSVRAIAPNGVFADAEMSCSSTETFARGKAETAIQAMAQTRAYNRAISDLVGGGEVSYEEMVEEHTSEETKRSSRTSAKGKNSKKLQALKKTIEEQKAILDKAGEKRFFFEILGGYGAKSVEEIADETVAKEVMETLASKISDLE